MLYRYGVRIGIRWLCNADFSKTSIDDLLTFISLYIEFLYFRINF